METPYHIPVLVDAVLRFLPTDPDGTYVDGTLGGGSHAEAVLKCLSPRATVIAFDRDPAAVETSRKKLEQYGQRVIFMQKNFSDISRSLKEVGVQKIAGVLLDLGVSSHQIDTQSRGFSFQADGRLDMRMDQTQVLDAWTIVNTCSEKYLAEIFWKYGEERNSRRIAWKIAKRRAEGPIGTTRELAATVESAVGKRFLTKTLARVFQAIRIEVNDELGSLHRVLESAAQALQVGGRMVVISYHSLEDRIVKDFFRAEAKTSNPSGSVYVPDTPRRPRLRILTKKPVEAGKEEVARNPRARSAKLRAAERA